MTLPSLINAVGIAAATLTTICWLPQAVKVLRDKETRAISLPATVTLMSGVVLWLIYGLAISDGPLIGANAVSLALMVPILVMKLRHG
jgi:MtN3 and saliva related transmembrane protein